MASQNGSDTGRILVVDDNEMNRDLLSRRLRRQGYSVEVAVNGRDALDQLAGGDYDLVLMDIMMPEMNGFEALEHLKADETLRHLPVIMISALDDTESIIKGIEMGADDHLPKPFNPTILRARIESSLAKKRLRDREQLHLRSLQRELEIGREIQNGFLPESLPVVEGWELAAGFKPARQVAGDFYDAFELPGDRVGILIADVCDKGVGAALFMAIFRSLIRVLSQQPHIDRSTDFILSHTIAGVNDYIARTHSQANMFATVFFAVLEPATGTLSYINAGHDAPILVGMNGVRRTLEPTGPAVGMMPELEFNVASASLDSGDVLFGYTDGATDARNETGELYGEERLIELITGHSRSAGELLTRVEAAVTEHIAGAQQFDDITLLALRRE